MAAHSGGQAGASARIENYLGFPTGISGIALMARAYHQAQKFGAEMAIPDEATGLRVNEGMLGRFTLGLKNGPIEHRLDRLARCLDVEAVLRDQVAAIDQDSVGVLQHLQPLEVIVMMQRHADADDF
jgi:hypothetical protein